MVSPVPSSAHDSCDRCGSWHRGVFGIFPAEAFRTALMNEIRGLPAATLA
jgi:hypothetical protein